MTIAELVEQTGFTILTPGHSLDTDVTGGCCCDLLSWVIAKGLPGYAWITVQGHMNVVAVAALHEFSCIILAEGAKMATDVLQKAESEGLAVLSTEQSGFIASGMLYDMGIGR